MFLKAMPLKATIKNQVSPSRMPKIIKKAASNVVKKMEQLDLSDPTVGSADSYNHYKKLFGGVCKS